jgi:hypothetical protein
MAFADPSFLWAYLVVLIPIILHLFNFRRYRKVAFSDLSLLKQINTQSKKSRQLKKWLILLSRVLALAALVSAFARPYIPGQQTNSAQRHMRIQIDNSFSMNGQGAKGVLFEEAKAVARELVQASGNSWRFQLYGNKGSDGYWMSKDEMVLAVDQMVLDREVNGYTQLVGDLRDAGDPTEHVVIISDFQQHEQVQSTGLDSLCALQLVRLTPQSIQNLSIDSVWMSTPVNGLDEPVVLEYSVSNHSDLPVNSVSVRLHLDGKQAESRSITIGAHQQKSFKTSFAVEQKGWIRAKLSLNDPYVHFDNTYYFDLYIKPQYKVLHWVEGESVVEDIFNSDPDFLYVKQSIRQADLGNLMAYDVILLEGSSSISSAAMDMLKQFSLQGGTLILVPPDEQASSQAFVELGGVAMSRPADRGQSLAPSSLENELFHGVFSGLPDLPSLPQCYRIYPLQLKGNEKVHLSLKDGSPLYVSARKGKGQIYQWAFPFHPEWSDFTGHELLVISMLRSVLSSSGTDELAYTLDKREGLMLKGDYQEEALVLYNERHRILLEHGLTEGKLRVWLNAEVSESGHYQLAYQNAEEDLRPVALNYSRLESVQNFADESALYRLFGSSSGLQGAEDTDVISSMVQSVEGRQLWKHFVILCLIFVLIEILLLRYFKS